MEILLFLFLILIASAFQGIAGFGFALIIAPFALLLFDKITTVVLLIIISLFLNIYLLKKIKVSIDHKVFNYLLIGGFAGLPLGIYILNIISVNVLRVIVGVLIISFVLLIYFLKIKLVKHSYLTAFVGFIGGILQTSTSLSGPPFVLLLTSYNLHKDEFRKILSMLFLILNIVTIVVFWFLGMITVASISYSLYTIPFVITGVYIGHKIAARIPQNVFRTIALITICITGIFSIYSGLK